MESAYDVWKTTPPDDQDPVTYCCCCGDPIYEGEVLYTIDGGICETCLSENYKSYA